jgi:hypothetical protein
MRTWAVESLLSFREEHDGDFPSYEELIAVVAEMAACSPDQADVNVWEALRREEIEAVFDDYADVAIRFGRHAFTHAPRWLRNHPWTRKEYS